MRPFSRDANNYSQAQITNFSGGFLSASQFQTTMWLFLKCKFLSILEQVGANSQRANHLVFSISPLVNKFITFSTKESQRSLLTLHLVLSISPLVNKFINFSTKKSQRSLLTLHLEKGVPNLHFSWSPKSVATCSLLSQFPTSSVA